MEEPFYIINTVISKEDYRRFLYISTFKKNKNSIILLGLIAMLGGLIIGLNGDNFNLTSFIISSIALFALGIITIVMKLERRNTKRIKTDNTGTFDSVNTLKFYDDKIVMENKQLKSTGELRYDQFYKVMESKDYFIFYININQASLIRKIDVENINAFREFIAGKFGGRLKKI